MIVAAAPIDMTRRAVILHATTVALEGRGVLILGPSGSGKSALALALMAWGAGLVADDRTRLRLGDGVLIATAPPAIAGRIEARGIGLLPSPPVRQAALGFAVDLGASPAGRLPRRQCRDILGLALPLYPLAGVHGAEHAVLHMLRHGPALDSDSNPAWTTT